MKGGGAQTPPLSSRLHQSKGPRSLREGQQATSIRNIWQIWWMRQKQREAAGEQTMGFRSEVSRDLVGTEQPLFQLGIGCPLD